MPCEGDHGRSRLRRRILGTVLRRLHFQDCGHARRGGERLVETEALGNEFHESTTTAGVPRSTRAGSTFAYQRDRHRLGAHALARDAAGGVGGEEQEMKEWKTNAAVIILIILAVVVRDAGWLPGLFLAAALAIVVWRAAYDMGYKDGQGDLIDAVQAHRATPS
jgi:hypothetical protein